MPIYVYKCTNCGGETEQIRSFSNRDNKAECDKCGGNAIRIPIPSGTVTPIFRGPRWAGKGKQGY